MIKPSMLPLSRNRFWYFLQIVSRGDNLNEISKHIYPEIGFDISSNCLLGRQFECNLNEIPKHIYPEIGFGISFKLSLGETI